MTALGLRNNNPFNLRDVGINWLGMAVPRADKNGFCQFISLFFGLRAGFINLHNAQAIHGRETISQIISAYAPQTENDTQGYIEQVTLEFWQVNNPNTWPQWATRPLILGDHPVLKKLGLCILRREVGTTDFPDALLENAVKAALGEK